MTSLSPSPMFVALVQAATTLPMFLLALPAGAMADIVDRRKLLLGAQALGLDHGPVARLRDHLGDGLLFLLGEVAVVQVAGHRRFGHTGQFCDF